MELDIEAIDYFRDEAVAIDPYGYLEYLSANRPVFREPRYGAVLVTGYEESLAVFRDTDTYSSSNLVNGPILKFLDPIEGDDITEFLEDHRNELPQSNLITTFDPPKHTDHRALLAGLITPKRLRENEAFMWRLADRQLDVVLPRGEVDFIDAYARPYTLLVVADLLGVPEDDHPDLLRRAGLDSNPILGNPDLASPTDGYDGLEVHNPYFIRQIETRRISPTSDVLSRLAHATFPDGTVPRPVDVARLAAAMFAAGQETTVQLLGTTLQRIATDRDLQRILREQRHLIPQFVEEVLRLEGPIKGAYRLVRRTTQLGGVDLPAGTTIMLLNAAANRDARQFKDPSQFRLGRRNVRRHVGFGHGIHTCPGAPLARSEVRITVERLFDRTADITVSEATHGPEADRRWDYMPTYMFRGLRNLSLNLIRSP